MFCPQQQVQLPVLETVFTPQELEEFFSFLDSTAVSPTSEDSNRTGASTTQTDSCSNRTDDSNVDEIRKRRRKLLNRESAQKSRQRKKQRMEELTEQVNRFTVENQMLKNRLGLIMNRFHYVNRENECLKSECIALLARLSDLYRIMVNVESMQRGSS